MNKEIKILILAALIAGLVFGFNDKRPIFEFTPWFLNFLFFSLLALTALFIHTRVQKYFSKKYGAISTHELWINKRFWFWKSANFPIKFLGNKINSFPTGIILPILVAIFSSGQILFAASLSCVTKVIPAYRLGKKYTQITEYELSKVALSGPLANILFAVILSIIGSDLFHSLILVNSFIAISYMIPLPGLAGSDIFFGSKNLYIFGLAFILFCAIFLNYINPISALIIAGIFAVIALALFFYYRDIK